MGAITTRGSNNRNGETAMEMLDQEGDPERKMEMQHKRCR